MYKRLVSPTVWEGSLLQRVPEFDESKKHSDVLIPLLSLQNPYQRDFHGLCRDWVLEYVKVKGTKQAVWG